jgi:hypothetical protein
VFPHLQILLYIQLFVLYLLLEVVRLLEEGGVRKFIGPLYLFHLFQSLCAGLTCHELYGQLIVSLVVVAVVNCFPPRDVFHVGKVILLIVLGVDTESGEIQFF